MIVLIFELLLLTALLVSSVYWAFLLPPQYPHNVPAVPFWVALIPFFKDVDQSDIFRKYIEGPLHRHGAVKLFFGAQWNILVHRPSYLLEIFKHEDVYQKSGNQKKIPHSVLADFLGDNIISSRGEAWKCYQSVIKPGLQRPFEVDTLANNASLLCGLIETAQKRAGKGGIPVQVLLQRYSVANCAAVLLQTELPTLQSDEVAINALQMAVKREIFKPIFMNFPILDRLPLPGRKRARNMVTAFKNQLKSALVASHVEKPVAGLESDKLGARLLAAMESSLWTEKQFLDNLTVTFVAGQENPQLLMISMLYLLAKHPQVQDQLLDEIRDKAAAAADHDAPLPEAAALQDLPLMTAVIYESLRLYPPIGQLINRRAAKDTMLGGAIYVPRGTYVGYNCYSTNRDAAAWGPAACEFRPERWGDSSESVQKHFRLRRARGEFISFHGGKRACLGERFAMFEMRVTLWVLVGRFRWSLDPGWEDRKTPVGRFCLSSGLFSSFSYPPSFRVI
ncbi:cytochrome P450 [Chaetomium fimeti]|uniref:Cytochrome P450 n=1 Tax=Chaetomium fimeti TaxID=1854472 RepID=A0AAE0HA34_9PEZI|nr:cytochrome P450 [Chaetomium fimeti]